MPVRIFLCPIPFLTEFIILMSIKAIIIHTLLLLSCLSSKECDEYIKNLINNNFLTLKNYTILYSGLAFNNPGQMEECQLLD